jgi:hypothetical protein
MVTRRVVVGFLAVLTVFALSGCEKYKTSGTVTEKHHKLKPSCYWLVVKDQEGTGRTACISEKEWKRYQKGDRYPK